MTCGCYCNRDLATVYQDGDHVHATIEWGHIVPFCSLQCSRRHVLEQWVGGLPPVRSEAGA